MSVICGEGRCLSVLSVRNGHLNCLLLSLLDHLAPDSDMRIGELRPHDGRSQDFPDSLKCALELKIINPEDLAILGKLKNKLDKS